MSNIQRTADRIFHHVAQGHLHSDFAVAMGALLEIYAHDDDVHDWVLKVSPSAIDKLLACMVRHKTWHDDAWILDYIRDSGERYADVSLSA